jgi:hypothetical protein
MSIFKKAGRLRLYLGEMWRHRNRATADGWLRHFSDWNTSLDAVPMADERPWITYGAIEFLDRVITRDFRICEYGVGGSTLFFAKRAASLVSIEHDENWGGMVEAEMKKRGFDHWVLHRIPPVPHAFDHPPDVADPNDYASSLSEYAGMSFRDYASRIDSYPDESFDLVQVDGRVRHSCAMHAIPKVKRGGYLFVDDTHRDRYISVHRTLEAKGWKKFDFFGPGPYEWAFRQTCGWQKP